MAHSMDPGKYANYSDNGTKDKMAFLAARAAKERGHAGPPPEVGEPSGFTAEGWDKYFFFSVPADVTQACHITARKGRSRPSMGGPQTFSIPSFSKEDLERAKKTQPTMRTTYTESYSQFPRSSTQEHGPVMQHARADHTAAPGTLARIASDSVLNKPHQRSAADMIVGREAPLARAGPYWPPPAVHMKPNSLSTRKALFDGVEHRTIVDLHAKDRKAPQCCLYELPNF
mmetsp:Transcript_3569/g.10347  ORF Transcript_3569/g.10347 Transcript_3569/m.10347 type:complete len:229 (-) Transcript_3569:47-733(-)